MPRCYSSTNTARAACTNLPLKENEHTAVAPHPEMRLNTLDRLLQQAVVGSLWQHAPPGLDGNGRGPEATTVLSDTRINPMQNDTRWTSAVIDAGVGGGRQNSIVFYWMGLTGCFNTNRVVLRRLL